MDKWITFYEQVFRSREAARFFVEELESIDDPRVPRHRAKIMMHQVQRLVSLADDISQIRKEKESLQLLFLIVCAENIAKLFDDFEGEGKSKAYVRKFFLDFVVEEDRELLEGSFATHELVGLDLQSIADCLYAVRCDVVHEGRYWDFSFCDGVTPMLNLDPDIRVNITFADFRDIIVRGCLCAIRLYSNRQV